MPYKDPEKLRAFLERTKAKRAARDKAYRQTPKGREVNRRAHAKFYERHHDKVLAENRKRREWIKAKPGKCDICGREGVRVRDHDHTTNRERGNICNGCNLAIGHARESIQTLKAIIAYLEQWKRNPGPIYRRR